MTRTPMIAAHRATDVRYTLGESPLWDAARGRILWVDIARGLICEGTLDDQSLHIVNTRIIATRTAPVSAVACAGEDLLVAVGGTLELAGNRRTVTRIIEPGVARRLNDGVVDPQGRFLIGSISLSTDTERKPSAEQLWRVEVDGAITVLRDGLTLSNGIAFSPDGGTAYHIDSLCRTIATATYPADTSTPTWSTAFRIKDGYPDGMSVDAEGYLWVAIWGLGQVRRYSPSGALAGVIDVDAPHVSSVAFVGHELDVLAITTATQGLSPMQRATSPASGALFLAPTGVPGLASRQWGGATVPDHQKTDPLSHSTTDSFQGSYE